jgi:SAM-dependent methyltransferase
MQAYGHLFAQAYNKMRWSAFAQRVAPLILDFYDSLSNKTSEGNYVLDLCCGTGQLAMYFLGKGYNVVGIDLSESMLRYAEENTKMHLQNGRVKFLQADATNFKLKERFGLVVSTYDALNHLEDQTALRGCFESVFNVSENLFIFDLNTQTGLSRLNTIMVDDDGYNGLVITQCVYDGQSKRAYMKFSGFVPTEEGLYTRFDEVVFNTVFKMKWVKETLLEIGWKDVYFARISDLKTPISEPEREGRIFVVASKMGALINS